MPVVEAEIPIAKLLHGGLADADADIPRRITATVGPDSTDRGIRAAIVYGDAVYVSIVQGEIP